MKKVFIFLAGAAIGSVVTYKLTERKFNKLIDEEIESVKETFKERLAKAMETQPDKEEPNKIVNINNYIGEKGTAGDDKGNPEYQKKMEELGYATGIDMAEEGTESQQVEEDESDYTVEVPVGREKVPPYVITEEEFGEYGNEEETLMFYADGKLVDENEELIVDPESIIGDALSEFYNDPYKESVYVRDENNEKDFVILKSEKTYQEVYGEEE